MDEDKSSQDRLDQLIERVAFLESAVRDQLSRLYAIEQRLGLTYQPAQPKATQPKPVQPTPESKKEVPQPTRDEPVTSAKLPDVKPTKPEAPRRVLNVPVPQGPPPPPPSEAFPAARAISKTRGDLETRIGGNWFNRIGIFAIAIGVAFFLKYAFDNDWIGPRGQVLIGAVIGLGFLAGGERLRARYATYAYGLSGGGILILYLSVFAAFALYHLIPHPVAFALMALITAMASLLSARYSALPIAVLGLIGGFLTPILLSTGQDNQVGLFSYIALLDLGVLALAYRKQWRSLNYMAFTATVLMFFAWWWKWYADEKLWTTVSFLTLFFAIFALLAVLYNVVNRRPTRWLDLSLVFANALLYFGATYELLDDKYHAHLGLFAVLVSTFYLVLGYFTYRRDREDRLLVLTFLGLAFLFLVLAVPIQWDQHWVTMGWAIEGAILTWIGLRVGDRTSRYAALVVFVIAVSHWIMMDMHEFAYSTSSTFVPLLNRRALSCAVLVAALAAASRFYKRFGSSVGADEQSVFSSIYMLGANVLAVSLLSLDANDYFDQAKEQAYERAGRPRDFRDSGEWGRLNSMHHVTLSALWTVYGWAALATGIARRLRPLRVAAFALLALAMFKALAIDLSHFGSEWHATIFNETFATFALLILALGSSAWFYIRAEGIEDEERTLAIPILVGTANLLAVIALSAQAAGHFNKARALMGGESLASLENTKQLTLTAVWTLYGVIALLIGVKRRLKLVRWASLILLALAALKVLVADLRYYDASWHTTIFNQTFAAFALVIAALALSAWFYSRSADVGEDERSAVLPVIVGVAHVLAIVALSAEALGHFGKQMRAPEVTEERLRDLRLARQLWVSVIWTVYGGAMLTFGILKRSRLLRMMALALLSITILKVFILDLSELDRFYRIISFIVLGAILLAVSLLYQRYRQRLGELLEDADAEAPLHTD